MGTLPNGILTSSSGDTIDCSMIAGQTITLTKSLPAITGSLAITAGGGAAVTIEGGNLYQAFSAAAGTTTITNFIMNECASIGGSGGN